MVLKEKGPGKTNSGVGSNPAPSAHAREMSGHHQWNLGNKEGLKVSNCHLWRHPMPNPKSTAQIAGHPIHPMLIPFPIACFVLTLISDLAFWKTSNDFWANASLWMLGIGLIMAALAAVVGLIDVLGDVQIRIPSPLSSNGLELHVVVGFV
jgi:Predicted membrane protein (DUF2231)